MNGTMIEFASQADGAKYEGYLSKPASGTGPGIIVIQEWWGLVNHIKNLADRFAAEGFVALAPDLYGGKVATEPDVAGKLMMSGSVNRLRRNGSTASGASGPPRLKRMTASLNRGSVSAIVRHGRWESPAGCRDPG